VRPRASRRGGMSLPKSQKLVLSTIERVGMCLPCSQTLGISPPPLPRTSRYEKRGDSEESHWTSRGFLVLIQNAGSVRDNGTNQTKEGHMGRKPVSKKLFGRHECHCKSRCSTMSFDCKRKWSATIFEKTRDCHR